MSTSCTPSCITLLFSLFYNIILSVRSNLLHIAVAEKLIRWPMSHRSPFCWNSKIRCPFCWLLPSTKPTSAITPEAHFGLLLRSPLRPLIQGPAWMVFGILGSYKAPFGLGLLHTWALLGSGVRFFRTFQNHDEALLLWSLTNHSLAYKSMKLRILRIV
jgi:hypothetical protein